MALLDPDLLRRQDYAQGFWFLMVGFALAFFDLHVNALDLLPDALGYAIAAYGAALLRSLHAWARHAMALSIYLAIVSTYELALDVGIPLVEPTLLSRLLFFLAGVGSSILVWILFQIVIELAQRLNAPSLVAQATTHRSFLVVLVLGATLAGAYFGDTSREFKLDPGTSVIGIGVFLLFLLVIVLVLRVFWQASNLCRYGRLAPPGGGGLFGPLR